MVSSAQHKLAKLSHEPVLKHFLAYSLIDAFTFADKIKNIKANNTFIALFDIILFTNVPLEKVIRVCVGTLYKISKPTVYRMNFNFFETCNFWH